jgi:hypothetical protein
MRRTAHIEPLHTASLGGWNGIKLSEPSPAVNAHNEDYPAAWRVYVKIAALLIFR